MGTADGRAELAYWRRHHPAAFSGSGGGAAKDEDLWRRHHPELYAEGEVENHEGSSDGVDLDASIDSLDAAMDAARDLRHQLDEAIMAEERMQEQDASYLDVWLE